MFALWRPAASDEERTAALAPATALRVLATTVELTDLPAPIGMRSRCLARRQFEELVAAGLVLLVPRCREHADCTAEVTGVDWLRDLVGDDDTEVAEDRPPPPPPQARTWFEVVVVDELGEPLEGIEVSFLAGGKRHSAASDGAGRARIEDMEESFALAEIPDVDSLRAQLVPRWSEIRLGEWLEPSDDTNVEDLREPPETTLVAEEPMTLSIQPRVVLARLFGLFFDTSKSFLLPSAIPSVKQLRELYDDNAGAEVLVVGHTDAAGAPSYNDPLSLERAEAFAAYLSDDVDHWLTWYGQAKPFEKRWGAHEDRLMIASMPDADTRPPGQDPVVWFQETRGLDVDGFAGEQTRRALVTEYMAHDSTSLPTGTPLQMHGCGENFEAAPGPDGVPKQENRRVELFFFADGVLPPPPGPNSGPDDPQYPEWVRRAKETHDLGAKPPSANAPVLEWPDHLTESLPVDLELQLSQPGGDEMVLPWTAGSVEAEYRRFVFSALRGDQACTLFAVGGGNVLRLFEGQRVDIPDRPPNWEHLLTELASRPPPGEDFNDLGPIGPANPVGPPT